MLVSGYGSSDSEVEGEEEEENPFNNPTVATRAPSESISNENSDSESDVEQEANFVNAPPVPPFQKRPSAPLSSAAFLLPSPLDALNQGVKPAFLTPEATRPIAELHRAPPPPKVWDGVALTPEAARAELKANQQRAADQGGVHAGKAVLYKNQKPKDEGTPKIDPLALAMLGVQANRSLPLNEEHGPEGPRLKRSVVLGTGEKGEVKEREKKKRMMGQNGRDSVSWKSEEEMILRQQFDS